MDRVGAAPFGGSDWALRANEPEAPDPLSKESVVQRYQSLREHIREGIALYQRIEEMPLDLDPHGRGEHLPVWLDCLNAFYRRHLKS